MEKEKVATYALAPGETTSEHQVMTKTSASSRIMAVLGAIIALGPQILDGFNMLPESIKTNKIVLIIMAIIGGLMAILAAIQKVLTEVAYINSRGLVKAATVRDVTPTAEVVKVDAPKIE